MDTFGLGEILVMRTLFAIVFVFTASLAAQGEEVNLVTALIERVQVLREGLGPEMAAKLAFEFDDKRRTQWSFFPGEHPGVAYGACSKAQQEAMLDVVKVALSASGFAKTELVRQIDDVLAKTDGPNYSSNNYFLSVWGEPGEKGPWSLRWEGHHISLNWLVRDGHVLSSTPQFIGTHPARVMEGPLKDTYPQAQEEQLARALVNSLDEAQKATAVVSPEAVKDVITHMKSEAERLDDTGIAYDKLSAEQQGKLRELIQVYIDVQAAPIAQDRAKVLTPESLASVKFAWYGSTQPEEAHYYRIQGNGWVIEYANTQHNVNHIHTTWRDLANDFGRDVLREHLAMFHPEADVALF